MLTIEYTCRDCKRQHTTEMADDAPTFRVERCPTARHRPRRSSSRCRCRRKTTGRSSTDRVTADGTLRETRGDRDDGRPAVRAARRPDDRVPDRSDLGETVRRVEY